MNISSTATARHNVSNLLRGLDTMELLLQSPEGLGVSDISRALDIPVNAAFRIASALVERGYLLKDDQAKTFTLSARLVTMGYRIGNRNGLVETAMPLMRELRDEIKETVVLCIMAGRGCIVLDSVPGLHMFRFTVDPGAQAALHASAQGKVLMAFLPDSERKTFVAGIELPRFNERTITSRKKLQQELTRVREQGYAFDVAEAHDGVHCVAAPVLDARGYPAAALTTTGPSDRLTKDKLKPLGEMMQDYALQISTRLGLVADTNGSAGPGTP
jgi:DNA-binding IclR family transcriptional regulator